MSLCTTSIGTGRKLVVFAQALTLGLLVWHGASPLARAYFAGSCPVRIGTTSEGDFGSGDHAGGVPSESGLVRWYYNVQNGMIVPTARVTGTLYFDKLGEGCAQSWVNFSGQAWPAKDTVCGPGWDANDEDNQVAVDRNRTDPALRSVTVATLSGEHEGDLHLEGAVSCPAPSLRTTTTINNGVADVGGTGSSHFGGSPNTPAEVKIVLQPDGLMKASVIGRLFVDSYESNRVRMYIDYLDETSGVLETQVEELNAPAAWNGALSASHQRDFSRARSLARIHKVRLRVGRVVNGVLTGAVTRTFSM